jgi:AhpD family alkylhydroperoxidase
VFLQRSHPLKIPKLSIHAMRSLLRAVSERDALASDALPRDLRKRIALHVSSINRCAVCVTVHQKSAAAAGLDDEQVAQTLAREVEDLDEPTRAALRYAELRTRDRLDDGSSEVQEAVDALARHFGPEQRAVIDAVVDRMTFNNRFNNTWEGLMPGASARRRRLGIDGE